MQHEAFLGFAFETFQPLHVVAGAKGGGDQCLRFAAGEDCAAVGSRQNSGFDPDLADLVEGAAIGTALLLDDLLAEDALAQSFVIFFELCLGCVIVFRNRGQQLFFVASAPVCGFRLSDASWCQGVGQAAPIFVPVRCSRPRRIPAA